MKAIVTVTVEPKTSDKVFRLSKMFDLPGIPPIGTIFQISCANIELLEVQSIRLVETADPELVCIIYLTDIKPEQANVLGKLILNGWQAGDQLGDVWPLNLRFRDF